MYSIGTINNSSLQDVIFCTVPYNNITKIYVYVYDSKRKIILYTHIIVRRQVHHRRYLFIDTLCHSDLSVGYLFFRIFKLSSDLYELPRNVKRQLIIQRLLCASEKKVNTISTYST